MTQITKAQINRMKKIYMETGKLYQVHKRTGIGYGSIYKHLGITPGNKKIPVVAVPQETFAEVLRREDKQNWRLFSIGFLFCALIVLMVIFLILNYARI